LVRAVDLALKTDSSLFILSVVPDLCVTELSDTECMSFYKTLMDEAKKIMSEIKQDLKRTALKVKTKVKFGHPAEKILDVAKREKADMIVIGSCGRHSGGRFLLGSVSSKIVEYAPCEVLVVKG
jgi:nucleotide-binding universal stress UspA family protein